MMWREPELYSVKIVKKFALFPITVGEETRWLEWVNIKYVYYGKTYTFSFCDGGWKKGWVEREFVEHGD